MRVLRVWQDSPVGSCGLWGAMVCVRVFVGVCPPLLVRWPTVGIMWGGQGLFGWVEMGGCRWGWRLWLEVELVFVVGVKGG